MGKTSFLAVSSLISIPLTLNPKIFTKWNYIRKDYSVFMYLYTFNLKITNHSLTHKEINWRRLFLSKKYVFFWLIFWHSFIENRNYEYATTFYFFVDNKSNTLPNGRNIIFSDLEREKPINNWSEERNKKTLQSFRQNL